MEKTIKDIAEKSHNAYLGKFWNRHLKLFQRWNEWKEWQKDFDSFCSRMWLDNEDENLTLPASENRMSNPAFIPGIIVYDGVFELIVVIFELVLENIVAEISI